MANFQLRLVCSRGTASATSQLLPNTELRSNIVVQTDARLRSGRGEHEYATYERNFVLDPE